MSSELRVPAARLDGVDDAELAWRAIEPAYHAVNLYDGPAALAADLQRLTPGQRALLALHWCISETLNGGFDQFLTNPSGGLAEEARAGFARIGASETAALLEQALTIFSSRAADSDVEAPGFDEAEDEARFEAYLAEYEPLEERFSALVDAELYPRAAAYVRAHPAEFTR